jgi:uncharacterized protein (TIGR02145 family)
MKKQFLILPLLFLALVCCGQQQKVAIDQEPVVKDSSSSSVSPVAKQKISPKKVVDSKPDEEKSLIDIRDGKQYKIVTIGTQIWMAENLNYNAIGSKCYDGKSDNCDKYGRLYSWSTAKSVCPKGWHLPRNEEWDVLYHSADGTNNADSLYESETAGKYLKAKSGWNRNGNGTDAYGFSALPGGFGNSDSYFNYAGSNGVWWSVSEYDGYYAHNRHITYTDNGAHWSYNNKSNLFSVRCMKD